MQKIRMTEMQKAYLIGRNDCSEGVTGTHVYAEIMFRGEPSELESAFNKVILSQPYLRARISETDLSFMLVDNLKFKIKVTEVDPCDDDIILDFRDRLSHKLYGLGDFPLFDVELVGSEGFYRIFFSIDMLIADGLSLYEICRELKYFLDHPNAMQEDKINDLLFMNQFYAKNKMSERYFKSRDYYLKNLDSIYPPPTLCYFESSASGKFNHLENTLSTKKTIELIKIAEKHNLSVTDILLTAFAMVLSKWSKETEMSINMTSFMRPRDEKYKYVVGDFTNSMLVESNINWNLSFLDNVRKMKIEIIKAFKHSLFEVPEIVRELYKIRPGITMPIVFTSMLFEQNELWDDSFWCDYSISQTSQVNLDCQIKKIGKNLNMTWDYRECMFDEDQIKLMFDEYVSLIESFIDNETQTLEEFCCRTTQIAQAIYNNYNSDAANSIRVLDNTLVEMFENTVREQQENTFITLEGKSYSFYWVYSKAKEMLASINESLRNRGIKKTRIAFRGVKKIETYIKIIASILSNNSFCIINEEYGSQKLEDILAELSNYVYVDDNLVISDSSEEIPCEELYVLFTSGTTGKPKGISISEKSVLNTVCAVNEVFKVSEDDVILNISNLCFDLSIFDIFSAMITGAEIISVNPLNWNKCKEDQKNKITIWNSTPGIVRELAGDDKLESIRLILMSGDFVSQELVNSIYGMYGSTVSVISLGGATEASIWSNYFNCSEAHLRNTIPYGYPLPNQKLFIVDPKNGSLCQENVEGEICIAGNGLALGYLDAEQTREAFIYNKEIGERIYRTGDLGYLSTDGKVYILGRLSHEIKHNGFRIDLKEIENYINLVEGVTNSICIIEKRSSNRTMLSAVIEASDCNADACIRESLSKQLPHYMVPSKILIVDQFPLTSNGKVDVKNLKNMLIEYQPDAQELTYEESSLLKLWSKTIPDEEFVEILNPHLTYFDAGGQSLRAVELKTLIEQEYKIEVTLEEVMNNLSLTSMTSLIKARQDEAPSSAQNMPTLTKKGGGELVLLRKGKLNKNIVLIHAGSGEINVYLNLARKIDDSFNVFAIKRNHDMSKVAPFDFDFSWFAKEYNEVLKRLPNVDILGGWCVGGAISYEMSLINPTKFKHLLFINSSSPVNNSSEPTKLTIDSELKILSQYVDFPLDNLPTSNLESFWEAVVGALDSNEELRLKLVRSLPPEAIGVLPPLDRQCALVTIYYINHLRSAYEAREHYKGSSKSNSSVLYLNAVDESMPNYSNWKNYVCRFEHIDVPGNHVTMFSNKNVSIWCNDFNKYINEIV